MEKQFFDVFPSLKLDKKNQDLFEQVMVEKVSATKRRDFIRVTIVSEYLISKEIIFKVENEIKKQLFASHDVKIKIYEKFKLSGQYTPEKLMDAYRESILLILKNRRFFLKFAKRIFFIAGRRSRAAGSAGEPAEQHYYLRGYSRQRLP